MLVTSPNTGSFDNYALLYTTCVPPNKVCLAEDWVEYRLLTVSGSYVFMTGILSPVSIASFTIALPVKRTISHGKILDSGTITTSPGNSSELSTSTRVDLPS